MARLPRRRAFRCSFGYYRGPYRTGPYSRRLRKGITELNGDKSPTLTVDERALLFYYCLNHAVARCVACARSFFLSELTADLLSGRTHLCPQCRRDLTEVVRTHLYGCTVLPAEVQQKAQALREAAHHLVKESRQLRDRADVLIREAEAAVEEHRRALWQALKAR